MLREFAQKLTDKLHKSAKIDWPSRKDSRVRMVAMVEVLLATHKCPPYKQPEAIANVISQAELLIDSWAA